MKHWEIWNDTIYNRKEKHVQVLTGISQTPHSILSGFAVRTPYVSAGTKEDGDAAIDSNNANNGAGGWETVETLRSCLLPPIKIKLDIDK